MNDERPIEKLLRRYAQKRRDETGDPLVLHPATRRLLQGEVARQFPKPVPDSKPSTTDFFALLARRWVYAVGIFVVLGISAAMLLPALSKSKNRALLAQKGAVEEAVLRENIAPAAAPAPALAPATPPVEAQPTLAVAADRRDQPALAPSGGGNIFRLRDESSVVAYSVTNGVASGDLSLRAADAKKDADAPRKREETKNVSFGVSPDSAAPATRALTLQPPARTAEETVATGSLALNRPGKAGPAETTVATDGLSETRQTLAVPPAAVTSAAPGTRTQAKAFFARGGGVEKEADRFYSQSFANVVPEQLKAKVAKVQTETPVTPVLANFQVQNVGNELRVIDSDGSTYLGEVSNTTAGLGATLAQSPASVSFESAGQLRTQTPASAATASQPAAQNYLWRVEGTNRTLNQNVVFTWNFVETNSLAASPLPSSSTQLPAQLPAQLQNSLIYGRAQIGPAQQIEVNAVPMKQ
jgi:hypothetical protein